MKTMQMDVLVGKPKECEKTFYAECLVEHPEAGHLYGYGKDANEAIECLYILVGDINQWRAKEGKEPLNVVFNFKFDITGLFSYYSFLNISEVAKRMGINASLMRRYASGETLPSEARLRAIENHLKVMADELKEVSLMVDRKRYASA